MLSDSESYSNIVMEYNEEYGVLPQAVHSIFSYEIIGLIDRAIEHGAVKPSSIKRYLLNGETFESPIGELSFDRYGDVNRVYHFYRYEDGQFLNE